MSQNNHLLNKCLRLKVIGKGSKGDFFGKINNVVCFIKLNDDQPSLVFDDVIDVKVTNVTEKCVFAELMKYAD
jgi:hypothetical protein